jgi:peptide/nickel transport system permease protein
MIEATRGPCPGGIVPNRHSFLAEQPGNRVFHLDGRQNRHGPRVVGHCKQHPLRRDDRHADTIDLRVQQIGTMPRRIKPFLVNSAGIGTNGDVLLDEAEVGARFTGPRRQIRLASIAMRDGSFGSHAHAVSHRGVGQRLIPLEFSPTLLRPGLVGHREQLLRLCRLRHSLAVLRGGPHRPGHRKHKPSHRRQHTQLSLQDSHVLIKPDSHGAVAVFFSILMAFLSLLRQRLRHQPLAVGGVVLLTAFVLGGVTAPWLAPHSPAAIDLLHRLESPSPAHWAGTDELGRDMLSRLLWGARLSLAVSVTVVTVSLALGITLGGLAGYLGGWIDTALTTVAMNTFLALPGILLAIAFAAFLGPGFYNLVLALAIGGWAGYARLVRAQVMAVRDREYVEAARALGASGLRIFFRHILPNIMQPILVQAAIGMAGVILAEATLSFLGLGIPAPAPSWGAMLNDARLHLFDSPHLVLFPAAAVAGAVLGFNFLGDALRDQLDPRTRLEMGL